jgi:hypothetical protein
MQAGLKNPGLLQTPAGKTSFDWKISMFGVKIQLPITMQL